MTLEVNRMSSCSVLRDIQNVSQQIAPFLEFPGSLTPATAAALINSLELIKGAVRSLPLAFAPKNDILNVLTEAQTILQLNGSLGLTSIEQLLSVLQLLQLAVLKVTNANLPCPQGLVIVTPSNTFSTICNRIC
jgi:hypothetical protein